MADQNANVPHNQELMDAISSAEQLLMFDENQDDDPLFHSFVDEMVQKPALNVLGNYGTSDLTGIPLEENTFDQNRNSNDFPHNSAFGNPIRIPIWPVPPSPHTCSCCQTLREFFHVNGTHVLKLDVHGRLGLISHAVLERYNTDISSQTDHEYHMFDFSQESISSVKQFLVQYCDDRKREGYVMLQDPLSHFYNALCIGLDSNGSADADIFLHQTSRGNGQMNQEDDINQPEEEGNEVRLSKSYIASQRERTGKMKLRDLVGYFHLPISTASKEMNICPSAIKSICRKEGLLRWPYRKIKSIEAKIAKKKQSLNSNDADERARALAEIQELRRKLANLYDVNVFDIFIGMFDSEILLGFPIENTSQ
ncbi:UNVERIFIED_CONTAM: protein NLP1 [Sesamum angustifolium]|uniref:Protein NLP1 n=1 Tax=Sesamum angustifolium TaxID=2727405 RepID=A0AAW2MGT0_9LAMI